MPLFDAYIIVDWSAANTRNTGRDSIWYTVYRREDRYLRRRALANPATRENATTSLGNILARLVKSGRRVLVGFDFPFGYPAGTAERLGFRGLPWRHMWQNVADRVMDDHTNKNNRIDVAEDLNQALTAEPFPFWGNVREETRPYLRRRGRRTHGVNDLAEWRLCDVRGRTTSSVWQLAGAGSVGSQVLTGIPRVWQLRCDPRLALVTHIWPFETGLSYDSRPQIILAEVYPSIIKPIAIPNKPKDAGQIVALARYFADLDEDGRLGALFRGNKDLSPAEKSVVELEEAWVLGVT
jgi:precorrin-8X/cobalt-precorrin-8 methylmutase